MKWLPIDTCGSKYSIREYFSVYAAAVECICGGRMQLPRDRARVVFVLGIVVCFGSRKVLSVCGGIGG